MSAIPSSSFLELWFFSKKIATWIFFWFLDIGGGRTYHKDMIVASLCYQPLAQPPFNNPLWSFLWIQIFPLLPFDISKTFFDLVEEAFQRTILWCRSLHRYFKETFPENTPILSCSFDTFILRVPIWGRSHLYSKLFNVCLSCSLFEVFLFSSCFFSASSLWDVPLYSAGFAKMYQVQQK